jgi:hypothetical protein
VPLSELLGENRPRYLAVKSGFSLHLLTVFAVMQFAVLVLVFGSYQLHNR